MALKSNYNEGRINRDVEKQTELINDQMLNSFIMAGEQFIIDAREQGGSHALGRSEERRVGKECRL